MRCGCSPALELRWGEFKTSPKCPDFSYFRLGMPRFLVSLAYTLGLAPFLYRFCEFLFRDPMESSDMASQPLSDRVTPKLLLGCTDCVTVMQGEPQVWFSLVASGGLGNMRSQDYKFNCQMGRNMIDLGRHDMFWKLIHSFAYLSGLLPSEGGPWNQVSVFFFFNQRGATLAPFHRNETIGVCILEKIIMTSVNFLLGMA